MSIGKVQLSIKYTDLWLDQLLLVWAKNQIAALHFTETRRNWTNFAIFIHHFPVEFFSRVRFCCSHCCCCCWWWCNGAGFFLSWHTWYPDVHVFSITVYPSSGGSFQQDDAFLSQKLQSSQIVSLTMTMSLLYSNQIPPSPDLNPPALLWDVVKQEIHIVSGQTTNLQPPCDAFFLKSFQHLVEFVAQGIKAFL